MAVGRDVPIAPPRHRRGARLGIVHFSHVHRSCPVAHYPAARWSAAGPPGSRRHYPRALRTGTGRCGAMGTSRPTAITLAWGSRALRRPRAPLAPAPPGPHRKPSKSPPGPPGLCASIHPVPSLFVPLCVNHSHSSFGAVKPRHYARGGSLPRTAFLLYNVKTANRVQPHRENQQNGSCNPAKRHSDRNALFQIRAPAPGDKPPENNRDEPTRTLDNVA